MGQNPLNLAVRFILEILALAAVGSWGWSYGTGALRYLLALGLPLLAAVLWGTFRVPHDSSHSGHAPVVIPGWVRLLLELALFGFATWGLFHSGAALIASIFGGGRAGALRRFL